MNFEFLIVVHLHPALPEVNIHNSQLRTQNFELLLRPLPTEKHRQGEKQTLNGL